MSDLLSLKLVVNKNHLLDLLKQYKLAQKSIVFTNGCFDILHAGHVDYLDKAKALGDVLFVAVNSDGSIKRIKGNMRPIVQLDYRLRALASLCSIDHLLVFKDDTPLELIKIIKPDILVKGKDWQGKKVVGSEYAKKLVLIDFDYDISTTKIINKVIKKYSVK